MQRSPRKARDRDGPEIPSNLHGGSGSRPSDFADFTGLWVASSTGPAQVAAKDPMNSLSSAIQAPAGFHRFQRIPTCRSTLSTAGLYDLYTRYGQSVDKKALLLRRRNYPQVPPQPRGALYRGFQLYKSLLKHIDSAFFHEIWPYYHHHALDLYPDLEARLDPIPHKCGLWTVAFPGPAATCSKNTRSATHLLADGTPIRQCDTATAILATSDREGALAPSNGGGELQDRLRSNCVGSTRAPARIPMLHVEQKKRPGKSRASFGSTWNSAVGQRRSGITT